ncbi:btb (poz) domain-containing 2a-related [Anaeramoeba flamelloides]|uniref:Btb (Poz) domain-containing 2a-related n=1 Tax=Anaeramoeba flamelloides TaxID=1746091 RepID=A0ABQ8XPK7_9EUKA|nr:btb (poz) domain-containing 2a-related [Anaeramoeba flamelloides]
MAKLITPMKERLSSLVNSSDMSDIKFILGENKEAVYGHQFILSINSQPFKELFTQNQDLEERYDPNLNKLIPHIYLSSVSPQVFKQMLQYCYTLQPKIILSDCLDVLNLSKVFKIKGLTGYCYQFLKKNINGTFGLSLYEKALKLGDSKLLNIIIAGMEMHSKELFSQKGIFNNLAPKTIKKILAMKNIRTTEIELFHRIIETPYKRSLKKRLITNLDTDLFGSIGMNEYQTFNFDQKNSRKKSKKNNLHSEKVIPKTKFLRERSRINKKYKTQKEIKVLLLAATKHRKYINDAIKSVASEGILRENISVVNANLESLSYEEIKDYDTIFIFSYEPFLNAVEVGNSLAKYVENGKGIVICSSDTLRLNHPRSMKGRIVSPEFLPFSPGKLFFNKKLSLGDKKFPMHPILKNVNSFNGGKDSFHIVPKVIYQNSQIIAEWSNKQPLVGLKYIRNPIPHKDGCVIILNIWPISNKVRNHDSFWDPNSDGKKLIANSINFAVNFNI